MSAWFRPKRFGFGASPSNWKGWLATLVFVASLPLARLASWTLLDLPDAKLVWRGYILVATIGFVLLVWLKSDEPWRWGSGSRY